MTGLDKLLKAAQVGEKKVLSKTKEVQLGTIIQSSTAADIEKQKAIEALVLSNVRLVIKLCHKYKRKEFEFEDLVGYGILGLFTAAKKFDPTRENRFASYARHWVKESIMKAIREYSGMPKIPVYLVKDLWSVTRALSKNNEYSDSQIAKLVNISTESVTYLRSLLFKFVPIEVAYDATSSLTPENEYIQKERYKLIINTLKSLLTDKEFIVLVHACELCGHPKMTFTEIEKNFEIKNPRKYKASAVKKLSQNDVLKKLYNER